MFLQTQGDVVWNFASDLLSDLVLWSKSKVGGETIDNDTAGKECDRGLR